MNQAVNPSIVNENINAKNDLEFYPSTPQIIECVKKHILTNNDKWKSSRDNVNIYASLLDCGAGDGRVLCALTSGSRYAIERSITLTAAMDKSIFVIGSDFNACTLLDKKVDLLYSNPPFSVFEDWAEKIIKEGNAPWAYLVMPIRWKKSKRIKQALELRQAKAYTIGEFDFHTGERPVRQRNITRPVLVEVVCVELSYKGSGTRVDPFELWFDNNFEQNAPKYASKSEHAYKSRLNSNISQCASKGELISSNGLIYILDEMYQEDMSKLMELYAAICSTPTALLIELGIEKKDLVEGLKLKLGATKDVYWNRLFNSIQSLTNRLCANTRKIMLDKLTSHTHLDFSPDAAEMVVQWAIKNANDYFDSQLIGFFETLIHPDHVRAYKSNIHAFTKEQWRWNRMELRTNMKVALDYRIVIEKSGPDGSTTHEFIDDLMVIANNLGYTTDMPSSKTWGMERGKLYKIKYRNIRYNTTGTLVEIRAYDKGSIHLKFDQSFMLNLNVEFGRLKGWVKHHREFESELDLDEGSTEKYFNTVMKIDNKEPSLALMQIRYVA